MSQLSKICQKRENSRHYISMSDKDIEEMLEVLGLKSLDELYNHIDSSIKMDNLDSIAEELSSDEIRELITSISKKNIIPNISFVSDELPQWQVEPIVEKVSQIRGLTTAYTPYQPERSQGTLITHWVYQSAMSALTGFEAVNCSLYDRSTSMFEAITASARLTHKYEVIVCESLFNSDIDVLKTLANNTSIKLHFARIDPKLGRVNIDEVEALLNKHKENLGSIIFPQVSTFGVLEDVDSLTDLAKSANLKAIAVVDPYLLGAGGLKEPVKYGKSGVDFVVGEAQHIYSKPNFGGPGLGLFAVRFNEENKFDIRQSPGRFVGRAKDISSRDAFVMVLSTREQHIRKEKATSNICSNQAFMATLAGLSLIKKGDEGMRKSLNKARNLAELAYSKISTLEAFSYPFGKEAFFNEFVIECPVSVSKILSEGSKDIVAGIDVSDRANNWKNLLKISFTDIHTKEDVEALYQFLKGYSSGEVKATLAPEIPTNLSRQESPDLPSFQEDELLEYYKELGKMNVSPDDSCYPLGSCTMKYNPYLNDEMASLSGFENAHPQLENQGCLEVLWRFKELIKAITGLDNVALQPVAGAQGELCALKMFQAWHNDNSKGSRDIILLPSSAHGTNFASAAVAGYENIIHIKAQTNGQLCVAHLKELIAKYGDRIAAIMITNPNTSGIFEANFKEVADIIHQIGALVYMDGANFNAIAGHLDLKKMGVDAIHNNIHKTWSIAHGGGGPGDSFVAVDKKLEDYIPSYDVEKEGDKFVIKKPRKTIGSIHRHYGNFSHKIRALAYILKLGRQGITRMSACSVLSARYLFKVLSKTWESLPKGAENEPRMHEFILTLSDEDFISLANAKISKALAIARTGKLFLDYGFHAPTVAFPEVYGLMIEPTESYDKAELDRFADVILSIHKVIKTKPEVVALAPRFTPIDRIDDVSANRNPILSEKLVELPKIYKNRKDPLDLALLDVSSLESLILDIKQ